jgi:hypothetical protein
MAEHGTPGPRVPAGALAAALFLIAACSGGAREQPTATASAGAGEEAPISQENGSAPLTPIPVHGPAVSAEPSGGASGELAWTVPEGFIEEPPKSPMRKAQYRLPAVSGDSEDGECVLYYFGAGQGGDVKSNLDRWAGQFSGRGSSPPKLSETKAGGLTVSRAEVRGTYTPSPMAMGGGPEPRPKPDFMLLGAIVPGDDANWFFKCTGPAKTMEANRARFDALLASVRRAQ